MLPKNILIVLVVVIVAGSGYAISQIFSRPSSQPTAVSSPFVSSGMGQADGAGDSIPPKESERVTVSQIPISRGSGMFANTPRLTTDDIDKQMQKNLAQQFSKPAESENQPKRPNPVNVQ